MGMFLSQYSMLKALGYQEDGHMKEETEKLLRPYKLFVLVLHDPAKHAEFHQRFSNLFERLDYLTGQHLLFMGITKPSNDWYRRNENRDYFGVWEKDQLIQSFHEIKGTDGSITSFSIASALGIDYDDLPCLIISPDFKAKDFIVLKTGEEHVEKQLMELGVFSSSVDDKRAYIFSEVFKSLLQNIDFYKQAEFMNLNESLGVLLADTFSFTVPENNHFGRDANRHSSSVLNKLAVRITETNDSREVENTKMKLLTNLANKYNNATGRFDKYDKRIQFQGSSVFDECDFSPSVADTVELPLSSLKYDFESLEPETKIIVTTTSAVYEMFKNSNQPESLDFSPLVLGLTKIFEIEINLSIVHWVRKHLNIEMPLYYKKFKPGNSNSSISPDESIVPNPKPVDFNMHKGAKWIAPGIGQSELIVRSLFKNNFLAESFLKEEISELLNAWAPIRESRNKSAHSEIMKSEDLERVALNLNSLIESNNLKKILNLKRRYQGNTDYPVSQ